MKLQGRRADRSVRHLYEPEFVTHPTYIREKARRLRSERDLTIDEIAERLAIPRQTIFNWVRDVPMKRTRRSNPAIGAAAMKRRHQLTREVAYEQGHAEWDLLCARPSFRDFVAMYIGEGYKRSRNTVALSNSDPDVIILSEHWMRQLSRNRVTYEVHHHADQTPEDLRRFWSRLLRVRPEEIRLRPKTNSGHLRRRHWRCRHGVMQMKTHDTLLRA